MYILREGGVVKRIDITEKMDTMEVVGWVGGFLEEDEPDVTAVDVIGIGCHDENTEILTEQGWKFFDDLKEEKVLTMNPITNKAFYTKPSRYFKHFYKGEMFLREGQTVNFCVTPNHKLFFRGDHGDFWRFSILDNGIGMMLSILL